VYEDDLRHTFAALMVAARVNAEALCTYTTLDEWR
jgi:hypothetical protein